MMAALFGQHKWPRGRERPNAKQPTISYWKMRCCKRPHCLGQHKWHRGRERPNAKQPTISYWKNECVVRVCRTVSDSTSGPESVPHCLGQHKWHRGRERPNAKQPTISYWKNECVVRVCRTVSDSRRHKYRERKDRALNSQLSAKQGLPLPLPSLL
ncbi:hypothetical protein J6590_011875 [Homalodisca vitripennis]|nr:hypothetical protein J6590_011875 [Homalodisca vitripennis]